MIKYRHASNQRISLNSYSYDKNIFCIINNHYISLENMVTNKENKTRIEKLNTDKTSKS